MSRVLYLLVAFLLFISCLFSCGDKKYTYIPYVYVDKILYPNTMDYIAQGDYKYVDAGYKGIIIYRITGEEFAIFDRACPYDYEKTGAKVSADPSGIICTDSLCGSKFSLLDGTVIKGPAEHTLKMYRYSFDGETLHIYN